MTQTVSAVWKPIDTAPKDNRRVLLGSWEGDTWRSVIGRWDGYRWHCGAVTDPVAGRIDLVVSKSTHWAEIPEPYPERPK